MAYTVGGKMTSIIEVSFGETQVGRHRSHTVLPSGSDVHHSVTKEWHCTPEQTRWRRAAHVWREIPLGWK